MKPGWDSHLTAISNFYQISANDPLLMKSILFTSGPISVAMRVYDDFYNYKGGVYRKTSTAKYDGDHAICCVGFDEKQKAWICKNSWSTKWGEKGYILYRLWRM